MTATAQASRDWYTQTLDRIEADKASDREVARLTGQTIEQYDADTTAPDPTPEQVEAEINVLAGRLMELAGQTRNLEIAAQCRPYMFDAEKLRAVCKEFDETLKEHDRLSALWDELKLDSLEFEPQYAFWPDPIDGGMVLVA